MTVHPIASAGSISLASAPLAQLARPKQTATIHRITPQAAPAQTRSDKLSFVVDLNDLGLHAKAQPGEVRRSSQCPVYTLHGPLVHNHRTGETARPGWIL